MKRAIPLVFVFFLMSSAFALEMGNPIRVQSADVNVIIIGNGTISGSIGANDTIEIKLQTFSGNETQGVIGITEILQIGNRTINATHESDEFGNRYAIFKISNIESRIIITIKFVLTLFEILKINPNNEINKIVADRQNIGIILILIFILFSLQIF